MEIGYKTDHDPYERATSAGPKTSKYMSQCLETIVRRYRVEMFDHQEAVELLTDNGRIIGLVTLHKKTLSGKTLGIHLFLAENFVLAAGGPGALYETSVYPLGQTGLHGIAFKAGLAAENLQSSLIDILVYNENLKGRRVFMDFLKTPIGNATMSPFKIDDLEPEAMEYLKAAGAMQKLPIERLAHMNPPAIDIYKEHDINLYSEPLEIAVCAQHNNGGFAVNKWWESSVPHTFIIGEMAGSHGVKRPGGSALNAGQVGAQRAAEFIVNAYGGTVSDLSSDSPNVKKQLSDVIERLGRLKSPNAQKAPGQAIADIQRRMTLYGGHIRSLPAAQFALQEAIAFYNDITASGLHVKTDKDLLKAVQAEHLALASAAYLKAIVELLKADSGSRGSHLVLADDGIAIHPDVKVPDTGKPLRFKPENQTLQDSILRITMDKSAEDLFACQTVPVRAAPKDRKAFEPAWTDYRKGNIYQLPEANNV